MSSSASQVVELAAGHQLDRYELICPVAQGGMASVWLARLKGKHGFEKLVALKTILPTLAEDKRFRRMLLAEAKIASRIEHVNVAQTLDLGEQDGHLYLVMEWVDGDSLSTLARTLEKSGLGLPTPILLRVMVEACAGLHAAHELCDEAGTPLGVVHRDVSPQNILVSAKGQTKLIDFGIAKAQSGPSEETRAGILKGKIHYMPPEQAMRRAVDRRTDVWAIGAVLYRMLCGRTPYESTSPLESLRLLTSQTPPAPLPPHADRELAELVMRALSPDPEHRPRTALELQAELDRVAAEGEGLASSQELATFVTSHLGQTLQERRDKITRALRSAEERDTEMSALTRTRADTPAAVRATEPDTSVAQPSFSSSALTLQMPSRAPEAPMRKRWVAASFAVIGLSAAFWSLSVRNRATSHVETSAPKTAAAPSPAETSTALPSSSAVEPVPVESVPVESLPAAPPIREELPPPVLPSALPLSPTQPTRAASPKKAVASKTAPRPKATATPAKRKVVDDGF